MPVQTAPLRWTAETELLVARTLYEDMWRYDQDDREDDLGPFDELDPEDQEGWLKSVRLSLAALDKVGLLLPSGGETRQETGHAWHFLTTSVVHRCSKHVEGEWCIAAQSDTLSPDRVRSVTRWPDGSEHIGAWVVVNKDGDP